MAKYQTKSDAVVPLKRMRTTCVIYANGLNDNHFVDGYRGLKMFDHGDRVEIKHGDSSVFVWPAVIASTEPL